MAPSPHPVISYRTRPPARKKRTWKLPRWAPLALALTLAAGAVAGAVGWAIHLDNLDQAAMQRAAEEAERDRQQTDDAREATSSPTTNVSDDSDLSRQAVRASYGRPSGFSIRVKQQ